MHVALLSFVLFCLLYPGYSFNHVGSGKLGGWYLETNVHNILNRRDTSLLTPPTYSCIFQMSVDTWHILLHCLYCMGQLELHKNNWETLIKIYSPEFMTNVMLKLVSRYFKITQLFAPYIWLFAWFQSTLWIHRAQWNMHSFVLIYFILII